MCCCCRMRCPGMMSRPDVGSRWMLHAAERSSKSLIGLEPLALCCEWSQQLVFRLHDAIWVAVQHKHWERVVAAEQGSPRRTLAASGLRRQTDFLVEPAERITRQHDASSLHLHLRQFIRCSIQHRPGRRENDCSQSIPCLAHSGWSLDSPAA